MYKLETTSRGSCALSKMAWGSQGECAGLAGLQAILVSRSPGE